MTEPNSHHERELERIRRVYRQRDADDRARYDPALPVNQFARQGQTKALAAALAHLGPSPLRGKTLLDVGCGEGQWFERFLDLGIERSEVSGVELDPNRAAACRQSFPQCDIRVADAADLPWPDGAFDVVFQSTVLSSVLDDGLRSSIAREMLRVLSSGGTILSYDFFVRRPGNRDVLAIGQRELRRLFPHATFHTMRVTLARPIATLLAKRAWPIAERLESLSVLNTHYLAVISTS